MSKWVSFTCSHKTKNQKQLEDYSDMISKKYENITSSYSLVYGSPCIKSYSNVFDNEFKTFLNSLRDDGFIINQDSIFELHREYEISKLVDLKRIMVGVLRAQSQMHISNRHYYNKNCKAFDNNILQSLQKSQDIDEFSKIYLKALYNFDSENEDGIKNILSEKNIKHDAWLDLIPLLRSYYKIKYESMDEPNKGLGTFYIKLKMLHKDIDEKSMSLDEFRRMSSIMIKNMQYIMF